MSTESGQARRVAQVDAVEPVNDAHVIALIAKHSVVPIIGCVDIVIATITVKGIVANVSGDVVIAPTTTHVVIAGATIYQVISALAKIAPLSRVDMFITDEKTPGDLLRQIELTGVRVIVAKL